MNTSFKKRTAILLSIIYLAAFTLLSAISLRSSNHYSLPIPNLLSALALVLPLLCGLSLEAILTLRANRLRHRARRTSGMGEQNNAQDDNEERNTRLIQSFSVDWALNIVLGFFLVYETVLVTLASWYISQTNPGDRHASEISRCALNAQWQSLYSSGDGDSLRAIQDSWDCCGFADPQDRAWPFPPDNGGSGRRNRSGETCMEYYGRTQGCFVPWREEERRVATYLLIVPLAVFVWTVVILVFAMRMGPSRTERWDIRPAWLQSALDPSEERSEDEDEDESRPRRPGLGFRTSRTLAPRIPRQGGVEVFEEDDSLREEVSRLNKDSNLASYVEGVRTKSHPLRREDDIWVPEDGEITGAL